MVTTFTDWDNCDWNSGTVLDWDALSGRYPFLPSNAIQQAYDERTLHAYNGSPLPAIERGYDARAWAQAIDTKILDLIVQTFVQGTMDGWVDWRENSGVWDDHADDADFVPVLTVAKVLSNIGDPAWIEPGEVPRPEWFIQKKKVLQELKWTTGSRVNIPETLHKIGTTNQVDHTWQAATDAYDIDPWHSFIRPGERVGCIGTFQRRNPPLAEFYHAHYSRNKFTFSKFHSLPVMVDFYMQTTYPVVSATGFILDYDTAGCSYVSATVDNFKRWLTDTEFTGTATVKTDWLHPNAEAEGYPPEPAQTVGRGRRLGWIGAKSRFVLKHDSYFALP